MKHVVLNARYHATEAEIVAQAGRLGAVTIATNMAGRGTDILLGGNPEYLAKQKILTRFATLAEADEESQASALEASRLECAAEHEKVVGLGGLHIIGTERHEARRIDNQLRGRAGRQGDPGSSRFYLSLEDDLMRIFGGDRLKSLMGRLNIEEGVPIESPLVSRSIERAQKQVEQRNFETRKHLLDTTTVMKSTHRDLLLRRELLGRDAQADLRHGSFRGHAGLADRSAHGGQASWNGVSKRSAASCCSTLRIEGGERILPSPTRASNRSGRCHRSCSSPVCRQGGQDRAQIMRGRCGYIALSIIDARWKDHFWRWIISRRAKIASVLTDRRIPRRIQARVVRALRLRCKNRIQRTRSIRTIFLFEPMSQQEGGEEERRKARRARDDLPGRVALEGGPSSSRPVTRDQAKSGRTDPVRCWSGRIFKKCHGVAVAP